ncbi:zinc-binding dehydrogenase [Seiridium cupressi]
MAKGIKRFRSPTSSKQWIVTGADKGSEGLVCEDVQIPSLDETDVLVKIYATSLKYRDVVILCSFAAVKMETVTSIIGFLGGLIHDVIVGSKEMMQGMVDAIEEHNIHPVLQRPLFPFIMAKEAYEHLRGGSHFGKVVIQIA